MTEDSIGTPALSREPTRNGDTAIPALSRDASRMEADQDAAVAARLGITEPLPMPSIPQTTETGVSDAEKRPDTRIADDYRPQEPGADEEEAFAEMSAIESHMSKPTAAANGASTNKRKNADDDLSEGVMAALSKLRKT